MKYIKLFEELDIDEDEFPKHGYELNTREKQILVDLFGENFLKQFEIIKEDNYYYTCNNIHIDDEICYYNQFDGFYLLKDYLLFIHYTLNNETNKLLELLRSTDLDPSFDDNYLIRISSEKGYTEVVKLLLQDTRVDPSSDFNYAIGLSSENGNIEVVKLLLKDPRVDPSDCGNVAINMASENGHTEVVKLLLEDPRVDPSDYSDYAIQMASKNGHTEVVKLLLSHPKVDPSVDNNISIEFASENNHIEIVKLLLQDSRVREKLTKKEIKKYESY